MHTQTASASERRARLASSLHVAIGLGLYLLTLAGEVGLGAGVRWLLTYLGASALGILASPGPSAEQLAWFAAFAPLAWSLLGLLFPGRGGLWSRRLGARRASADEATAIDAAIELLRASDPTLLDPRAVYVLDDPLPLAAARGEAVLLSRGLLEFDSLPAALAHELGHIDSLDGRLTEALERLALWGDPLAPPGPQRRGEERIDSPAREGGLLLGCIRWLLRAAGGTLAQDLLSPLWASYWRAREYAADAYAASLGQATDLARHLCEQELPFDVPRRRFPLNRAEHPPVALRIERLQAVAGAEVSK